MNLVKLSQYKIKLQPNITASFITFIQTQNPAKNKIQDQNPSKTLRTVSAVCPVGWSCLSSKTLPRSSSILLCWILCLFKALRLSSSSLSFFFLRSSSRLKPAAPRLGASPISSPITRTEFRGVSLIPQYPTWVRYMCCSLRGFFGLTMTLCLREANTLPEPPGSQSA